MNGFAYQYKMFTSAHSSGGPLSGSLLGLLYASHMIMAPSFPSLGPVAVWLSGRHDPEISLGSSLGSDKVTNM